MATQTVRWSPDWCSCQVSYSYDNSLPMESIVFTGSEIHQKCPAHQNINDPVELYNILHTETLTKERTRQAIIDTLPDTIVTREGQTRSQDTTKLQVNFVFEGTDPRNRTIRAYYKTLTRNLTTQEKTSLRTNIKTIMRNDSLVDETRVSIFDLDVPNDRLN